MFVDGSHDRLGPIWSGRKMLGTGKRQLATLNRKEQPRIRLPAFRHLAGVVEHAERVHERDKADDVLMTSNPAPADIGLRDRVAALGDTPGHALEVKLHA